MVWSKTKNAIRDVFSGKNFGEPGDLQNFFRAEYRSEYENRQRSGENITDQAVFNFISKHR